jgi:hypothetical protein
MVTEELIRQEYNEANIKYRKLLPPEKVGGGFVLKGSIDVVDDDGGYWDNYEVSILVSSNYPMELPILLETGKKIERHEDWHNREGICCLSTNAKMYSVLGKNITLFNWLEKFAHPFLANHVYRIKTGNYANKEFDHGTEGIIQGYCEIFNVKTEIEVVERLELICGSKKLGRNDSCFCGGGKKYKKCFLLEPSNHYFNIPIETLKKDLKEIIQQQSIKQ